MRYATMVNTAKVSPRKPEPKLEESYITETVRYDDDGRVVSITFEWPTDRAVVSGRLLKQTKDVHKHGDRIYLGAFPLRIVEEDDFGNYVVERIL